MNSEKHHTKSRMIWRRIARFIRRYKKALMVLAAVLFFVLVWPMNLLGMAPVRALSVTAQVVDAETGAPLQEVVVVATWPSVTGTLAGGPHHWGTIRRMETQTDEEGFFHLPSWVRIGFRNWISETDPEIYLYRAGYWPRTLKNDINKFDQIIIWPESWVSDWDGKVVKLEPMHWREWTKEECEKQHKDDAYDAANGYLISILRLNNDDRIWPPNNCDWKRRPRDFLEGMRYQLRMMEMLLPNRRYKVVKRTPDELKKIEKDCGADPYQYLKRYGITDEEWYACCAETAEERAVWERREKRKKKRPRVTVLFRDKPTEKEQPSPRSTVINMQSFKVMPDGQLIPLDAGGDVGIESASLENTDKNSGKKE